MDQFGCIFDILYRTNIKMQIKGRERCVRRKRNVKIKYVRGEERINERRQGKTK
jgi:hypothetical protein